MNFGGYCRLCPVASGFDNQCEDEVATLASVAEQDNGAPQ